MPIGASRIGFWSQTVNEVVTEVTVLRAAWGPDVAGGNHAITFTWATNTGRTGRVNTDVHLSSALRAAVSGPNSYNGVYALSLIGEPYKDVKDYLNAGTQFDIKPPSQW